MAGRVDLVTAAAAAAGLIVAAGVNPDGARLREDELRDQMKAYVDTSDDGAP